MVHLAAAVIDLSIIAQVWPLDGTDTTISFQEQKIMLEFENETINFSNLVSAEVLVSTMENSIELCGISLNILRSTSDMYGLAFAPS